MEDYLEAADTLIVLTTFRLLAGFLLVVFLIKRPRALLYGAGSILALSFVVFFVAEWLPSAGDRIYLDGIRLHYYNKLYIADDQLVHRLSPHLRTRTRAYKGDYPFLYGIEVKPTTIEWVMRTVSETLIRQNLATL